MYTHKQSQVCSNTFEVKCTAKCTRVQHSRYAMHFHTNATHTHTPAHVLTRITILISFCFRKYLLVVGVGFLIELVCHKLLSCLIASVSVFSVTSNETTTQHSKLATQRVSESTSQRASQTPHARIQKHNS